VYITIDERDRRPIYLQVADGIKGLIARGILPEGASLPPVRQVASDLGVNLNTIAFAYRHLQQDGLIKIKHGSGAVVVSRLIRNKVEEPLMAQLHAALTHLVLSGLTRTEILQLVTRELDDLARAREHD
jgi:GntR family transcriptional regulator